MEQRLSNTEVLLYNALSQLRVLKVDAFPGSSDSLIDVQVPEPIPREVNMSKHARMEEWKQHPLKKSEDVERWRKFMAGGEDVSSCKLQAPGGVNLVY